MEFLGIFFPLCNVSLFQQFVALFDDLTQFDEQRGLRKGFCETVLLRASNSPINWKISRISVSGELGYGDAAVGVIGNETVF